MPYPYGKKEAAPDTEAELKRLLKAKEPLTGCWLLCGKEQYLADSYLSRIRTQVIPDEDNQMDHVLISGTSLLDQFSGNSIADSGDIPFLTAYAEAAKALPLMGEYKLIELHELPKEVTQGKGLKQFCQMLSDNVSHPYLVTVLRMNEAELPTSVYRYDQTTLWKSLAGTGIRIVNCEYQVDRYGNPTSSLLTWCERHLRQRGVMASEPVLKNFIGFCGPSMVTLASEMEKLSCYVLSHGEKEVKDSDIPAVCVSSASQEDFAMQTAVRTRNFPVLLSIYRDMLQGKDKTGAPLLALGSIHASLSELWRVKSALSEGYDTESIKNIFHMKDYPLRLAMEGCRNYSLSALEQLLSACSETDIALKGGSPVGPELVERLICCVAPAVFGQ